MYQQGQGVPKNYTKSVKWYRLAADQGNDAAQCEPRQHVYTRSGVQQNDVEAMRMVWTSAADQGNVRAKKLVHNWKSRSPQIARISDLQVVVPLTKFGGTYVVPIEINGAITLDFTVDSGAADERAFGRLFNTEAKGTIR